MYQSRPHHGRRLLGFSLIELVIVIVIIGIIGAIAIPRISRGAEGASESAFQQDLAVMNKAIDLYAAEHGGSFPDASQVMQQLLYYTDARGDVSLTPTTTHVFGPYLRAIPPAPAGESPGSTVLSATDGPMVGWLYNPTYGRVYLNRETVIDASKEDSFLSRIIKGVGL